MLRWSSKQEAPTSISRGGSLIQATAENIISSISNNLSDELSLSPIGIEDIKEAIGKLYARDGETPNFDDLHHVDLLYTNGKQPLQYTADLIDNKINVYDVADYARYKLFGGEPIEKYGNLTETYQYKNAKDLLENGMPFVKMATMEGYQERGSVENMPIKESNERKVGNVLYAPVYNKGWSVTEIPIDKITWWGKEPTYAGVVYDKQRTFYATEEAAWDYIGNVPGLGIAQQVEFDDHREPHFVVDHEERYADQRDAILAKDAGRHPQKKAQAHIQAKQKEHKKNDISL